MCVTRFLIIGGLLLVITAMLLQYKKRLDDVAKMLKGIKTELNFIHWTTELTDWAVRRVLRINETHTCFDEEAGEITIKVKFDERNQTVREENDADEIESDTV